MVVEEAGVSTVARPDLFILDAWSRKTWWAQQDSNLRPTDYESAALPLRHGPSSARLYRRTGRFRVRVCDGREAAEVGASPAYSRCSLSWLCGR